MAGFAEVAFREGTRTIFWRDLCVDLVLIMESCLILTLRPGHQAVSPFDGGVFNSLPCQSLKVIPYSVIKLGEAVVNIEFDAWDWVVKNNLL